MPNTTPADPLAPLAHIPAGIDVRTREGKRYKPVLIAAATALRREGHTWSEIAAAVGGMSASGFSLAVTTQPGCLCLNSVKSRPADPTRVALTRQKVETATAEMREERERARAANVRAARNAMRSGQQPWWHLPEPTVACPEIQALVDEQAKEQRQRVVGGSWQRSLDTPVQSSARNSAPMTGADLIVDTRHWTDLEELEDLMRENGVSASRAQAKPSSRHGF